MKKVSIVFWWRLWHACGVGFWTGLAARLPKGSVERLIILIPFCIHVVMFFSRAPAGRRPSDG